jgi:hypothetical protein
MDGAVGQRANEYRERTVQMPPLAWGDSFGFRTVVTRSRDITDASRLAGLKIRTIQSSIYGYLAETRRPSRGPADYVERPVGLALFPRDALGPPPRRLAERTLNVVHWAEMSSGGHFGAWERPREYAADLRNFHATLRGLQLTQAHHERERPSL